MSKSWFLGRAAALAAGFALVTVALSALADGTTRLSVPMKTGVHLNGTLECSNSPGPQITLSGGFVFDGMGVRAIFRNNVKGTHEHSEFVTASAVVIPAGHTITIPKQPVLGGAGGNPRIYIQFVGANGQALSDEYYIGKCVQSSK